MGAFIQNAVSYFEKRMEAFLLPAINNTGSDIVAGYSFSSREYRHEPSPESSDQHMAGMLYANIVDYERLVAGEGGLHRRLAEAMDIMKACIAATQGRITRFAGDAILAEFPDADSALRCAVNVQLAIRRWNIYIGPGRQLRFRIGVHYGNIASDRGGSRADAVKLADLIEGLAHCSGICVSRSARANLANQASFRFLGLGRRYVKNLSAPVEAFWIEFGDEQLVGPGLTAAEESARVNS